MTTKQAERAYLAEHLREMEDKDYALVNPRGRPVGELPAIYGFNNGGEPGWYHGVLMAEDGTCLGGHVCSDEGYMPHDLGILTGTRADRHETFLAHYPDGYRMEFIGAADVRGHAGLAVAFAKNQELAAAAKNDEEDAT